MRNDIALTGGNAGNRRGRVIHLPDLVVMVEGSDRAAVAAAGEQLSERMLVSSGAAEGSVRGLYQLEYSIQTFPA